MLGLGVHTLHVLAGVGRYRLRLRWTDQAGPHIRSLYSARTGQVLK